MQAGGQRFESVILHSAHVCGRTFFDILGKRKARLANRSKCIFGYNFKHKTLREQFLGKRMTISQGQLKVYETTTVVSSASLRAVDAIRFRTSEKVGKGEWWMPRLLQAMKDVISCEKPR